VQESKKQGRLLADRIEVAGGFLFGGLRSGQRRPQDQDDVSAIALRVQVWPPANSGL
jgi:hypothetical protein